MDSRVFETTIIEYYKERYSIDTNKLEINHMYNDENETRFIYHIVEENKKINHVVKCVYLFADDGTVDAKENKEVSCLKKGFSVADEGVIQHYDSFRKDETLYIIMQYGDCTLEELIKNGIAFNKDRIVSIISNIINTVAVLHKNSIFHLDIKPANIIVYGDNYKLFDFGIATQYSKTRKLEVQGTKNYAPPEMIHYEETTPQLADIYEIGMLLFVLANGNKEMYFQERIAKKQALSSLKSSGDSFLDKIIDKATCYESKDRYQNLDDMLEDLKKWSTQPNIKDGKYNSDYVFIKDNQKEPKYESNKTEEVVNRGIKDIKDNTSDIFNHNKKRKKTNDKETELNYKTTRLSIIAALVILILIFGLVAFIIINEKTDEGNNGGNTTKITTATPTTTIKHHYVKDKWLTSLTTRKVDEDVFIEDTETNTSNTGKKYSHRIYSQAPCREVSFYLNGDYNRLKGVCYLCEDSIDDDHDNSFYIYADGVEVYKSPTIKTGELPYNLYVNIGGCKILTIQFRDGIGSLELGELKLTNTEKKEQNNTEKSTGIVYPNWLTQETVLQRSDSINVEDENYNYTNTKEVYSHYISADGPGTIEFFLDGKYDTLTGLWGIEENSIEYVDKESFEIYADGKKVFTSLVLKKGSYPQRVFAIINKCKKLTIKFTNTSAQAEFGNIVVKP